MRGGGGSRGSLGIRGFLGKGLVVSCLENFIGDKRMDIWCWWLL